MYKQSYGEISNQKRVEASVLALDCLLAGGGLVWLESVER
jgi:hypothetical protein